MELKIIRIPTIGKPTIGELWIDGQFFSYTLEDEDRGLYQKMPLNHIQEKKLYGETAIPYGEYKVKLTWSPKFGRKLPLVLNVKGYEGIRFHRGNYKTDTLGCPLVGYQKGKDSVWDSRTAEEALVKLFEKSPNAEHSLEIIK